MDLRRTDEVSRFEVLQSRKFRVDMIKEETKKVIYFAIGLCMVFVILFVV